MHEGKSNVFIIYKFCLANIIFNIIHILFHKEESYEIISLYQFMFVYNKIFRNKYKRTRMTCMCLRFKILQTFRINNLNFKNRIRVYTCIGLLITILLV